MRCKNCGDKFTPKKFLMKYCDKDECQSIMVRETLSKVKKFSVKEKNKATKVLKDSLKTKSDYLQLLQITFNAFIRERDKNEKCISCDAEPGTYKLTAGHFYPTTYQALRFNEDNVHSQCWYNCNKNKHGNINEYRPRLEKKIGVDRVQWLHAHRHDKLELTTSEILDLITKYKQKIKELK